jgi:glycine/D-amino acid oxidase-like deaminating enzyme
MRLDDLKRRIYWWDTVEPQPRAPLRGDLRVDVAIAGGGFTGLWTAYHLKRAEPSLDVAVLEREWVGSGASGHNDGFAIALLDLSLPDLIANWGLERANAAHEAVGRAVEEIGEFCDEHGVDADYRRPGFLSIARSAGEQARLEADMRAAAELGCAWDFELFEGDAAQDVLGSPTVRAALREGRGAQLNPLALAQGIARACEELGVRVYERTPVLDVVPGDPVVCRCDGGRVEAASAVIATNASAWQLPAFRRKVLPLWSYALVSKPLTDEQIGRVQWRDHIGYEDKRVLVSDGRLTPDNRFLCGGAEPIYFFGNSMRPRHADAPRPYEQLHRDAMELFPMWHDLEWDYAYAGCMGMTPSFVPYFGSLSPNLHYGLAYNGHGVAPSHTGGKVLRDLVLRRRSEYTELFFVNGREPRWPPEPIRFVGARLTTRLVLRDDLSLDRRGADGAPLPGIMRLNKRILRT